MVNLLLGVVLCWFGLILAKAAAPETTEFRASFSIRTIVHDKGAETRYFPTAVINFQSATDILSKEDVSLVCGEREIPIASASSINEVIDASHATNSSSVDAPKLCLGTRTFGRASPLGLAFVHDHPLPLGLVRTHNNITDLPKGNVSTEAGSKIVPSQRFKNKRLLVLLDVNKNHSSTKQTSMFKGWLQQCRLVLKTRNETSYRAQLRISSSKCSLTDWMTAISRMRHLVDQAVTIAHRRTDPLASTEINFLETETSTFSGRNNHINYLGGSGYIQKGSSPHPVSNTVYRRAFGHDISESMRVNMSSTVESFNSMLCRNKMVSPLRTSNIHRDIGEAAQGWLPDFLMSAITPIGKAIVNVIFKIVPVIKYIIKGMIQALVDLILFGVVNTVSDIVIGPDMGVINSAIIQEIVFGCVPVLAYMITGHFTVRITKGAIPEIAQAMKNYIEKEAVPTITSATSHTLVSFVSEALTMQLPRRITHALTFTLSNSLTHVVPKYYYCQYCMEKNEYCGYCYGYWRSIRANRAWWQKPEKAMENAAGARDLVPGIPGIPLTP